MVLVIDETPHLARGKSLQKITNSFRKNKTKSKKNQKKKIRKKSENQKKIKTSENNKTTLSAMKLSDEIATAPAIILICATAQGSGPMGSVIPAVHNLLLTARSLGIGGTITTLHPSVEDQVKSMFNMPENVQIVYCVPIGYPIGNP